VIMGLFLKQVVECRTVNKGHSSDGKAYNTGHAVHYCSTKLTAGSLVK
jgi:hypothetical protein